MWLLPMWLSDRTLQSCGRPTAAWLEICHSILSPRWSMIIKKVPALISKLVTIPLKKKNVSTISNQVLKGYSVLFCFVCY